MTNEKRRRFLERFARDYNLPGAAVSAGITRGEAYALLKDARDEVDRLVSARLSEAVLASIRREYERMAFDETGEIKPGERIRALENLRLMASAGRADGGAPSLIIRCEYV